MTVHSVSDVTRYIKGMFEHEPILSDLLIRGEVSNYKRYPSGHAYFTLKDAGASMKCVMFNGYARNLRFAPENGMQVIAGGNISVYERDGAYQLYVSSLTPEGAGALALAFEQMRDRLAAEGLFDEGHKQPLPRFPRRIGIVTSSAGAVLRDIHNVSKRRWRRVDGEGSRLCEWACAGDVLRSAGDRCGDRAYGEGVEAPSHGARGSQSHPHGLL